QHQLRVVAAGQRHQYGRLGMTLCALRIARTVAAHTLQELVEHDGSRFFSPATHHGMKALRPQASATSARLPATGLWRHHGTSPQERSEEHTSELQSRENLVCRLLLEKKKNIIRKYLKSFPALKPKIT